MPPVSASAFSCSSVRLRAWLQSARQLEWVATTGPAATSMTSPERFVIDVGHVQDHAKILDLSHCLSSQVCQPAVRIASRAGGQRVFFVPGQACVTGAELIKFIDPVYVFSDAL